jgi:hypothetical protein
MQKLFVIMAGLSLVAARNVRAQANTCPPGTVTAGIPDRQRATQDACQMAVDVFQFMAPQLGLALTGGNATLGQASTLGGLGHFSIGVRGNVFKGDLPQVQRFPQPVTSGRVQRSGASALPSKSQVLGLPTADAAIGIFGGLPLALTNVGGVDLLLSASYVPKVGDSTSNIRVSPDQSLNVGYGVRVGLLSESILVPGVSLTYIRRDLPTTTITGTSANLDVAVRDTRVKTSSYRVVASKSLMLFGLAAGVGRDTYDQGASVQGTVKSGALSTTSDAIVLAQAVSRTNVFLDVSMNLPFFKFTGEVGNASSISDVTTYNSFTSGDAGKSRTYGSLGIRFGF